MASQLPLRVAFLHRGHVFAGAEESMVFNARDLQKRGHDVCIVCLDAFHIAERFEKLGFKVHRNDVRLLEKVRQRGFVTKMAESLECRGKAWRSSVGGAVVRLVIRRHLRALRDTLARVRPDVFFGNMQAGGDHPFLRLAHDMGIGTASYQQITPPLWVGPRVIGDLNAFCGAFISNSNWTRECWKKQGLRDDRHELIYYTIPSVPPAAEDLRARAGLGPDDRMLVSVGRLSVEKEFPSGIRAFAAVASRHRRWHYVIIGEGDDRAALESLIRELGLQERVHLVGSIPGASGYLHQADVFLHPAHFEHFGRVVAEAMLAETPTIGHATGGVPEMIEDGVTGYLFSDALSLEQRLETAFSTKPDADMLRRANERILAMCGQSNADVFERVLIGVAARRRAESPR